MNKPKDMLGPIFLLLIEGIIMANQRNYHWCLNYLRRCIETDTITLDQAATIWASVMGTSTGATKDFADHVIEIETTLEKGK